MAKSNVHRKNTHKPTHKVSCPNSVKSVSSAKTSGLFQLCAGVGGKAATVTMATWSRLAQSVEIRFPSKKIILYRLEDAYYLSKVVCVCVIFMNIQLTPS